MTSEPQVFSHPVTIDQLNLRIIVDVPDAAFTDLEKRGIVPREFAADVVRRVVEEIQNGGVKT